MSSFMNTGTENVRRRERLGKIARLRDEVREELNQRIKDGEAAETTLAWLNGLSGVKGSLKYR